MIWYGVRAAAFLIALVLAGCSNSPEGTGQQDAGTTSYSSERLGYGIALPAGWHRTMEASTDWEMPVAPVGNSSSFDTYESDTGDPFLVVGRQALSTGKTLATWIARLAATDTITYPSYCEVPAIEEPGTLDGEPAQWFARRCQGLGPNTVIAQVVATHGREGYVATCHSDESSEGKAKVLLADCEDWLSTFAFLD